MSKAIRLFTLLLVLPATVALAGDTVMENGEAVVPGTGGRKVEYRYTGKKAGDTTAHFWLDITNPATNPAVSFVVCAMLNMNTGQNMAGGDFSIQKDTNGNWDCVASSTNAARSGFHFGCKRMTLQPGQKAFAFDEAIDMGRKINDVTYVYFDVLKDCALNASCNQIRGRDKFTGPGAGVATRGPNASFNAWAQEILASALPQRSEGFWALGNWVTMAFPKEYSAILEGTLTGAPPGSLATLDLPPIPSEFVIADDPFVIRTPFFIPEDPLAEGSLILDIAGALSGLTSAGGSGLAEGSLIRFHGDVRSDESNLFYQRGDFMYAIDLTFVADTVAPVFLNNQIFECRPGRLCVDVAATDETTLVAGATLLYSVDGAPEQEYAIPFGDPAAVGDDMFFRGFVSDLPLGSSVGARVALIDTVGNRSESAPVQVPITGASACIEDETTLCLADNRFELRLDWATAAGDAGPGRVAPAGSNDSGIFYFFDPDNWEMLVKVLDACSFSNHFWVFYAATTNVEFTLTVTDTQTGMVRTYGNPQAMAAAPVQDTQAFATCP